MTTSKPTDLLINCSPQQLGKTTTGQVMLLVMAGCLPAVLLSTYFFGIGTLLNIALASMFSLAFEAAALKLRGNDVYFHLCDNSALVTALLLGISIPPGSVWWLTFSGAFFSIVIAKHAFGGLGQNPFNPAMCGYAMLLLFFPLAMTSWHIPVGIEFLNPLGPEGLLTAFQFVFPILATVQEGASTSFADSFAMAPPLIEQKLTGSSSIMAVLNTNNGWRGLLDRSSGAGWELVNMAFLLGGLFLIWKKIISWHIPVSIIGSILLLCLLFYSESSGFINGSAYLHLFGGATMIGAFFIATDPVSAASTAQGKLVYGAIIGCSIYSIRVWGSYLDSVAFAVLMGNFCAPLIDRLFIPRIYGHPGTRLWKFKKQPH